jgi:serine/threonine protein kinase
MGFRDVFGLLGQQLERRYLVDSVVGEGGFGVVYRATNEFGERVAVKCLRLSDPNSEAAAAQRQAFSQEGHILRRLSKAHPAIVEVLALGSFVHPQRSEVPYLVLEWLDGTTLDVLLRQRGRSFSETEVVGLLTPVLEALAVAHSGIDGRIVAHRDIKPENLFVVHDQAKVARVKLLDFGIAKVFDQSDLLTHQATGTAQQFRAFSPLYGAPEQFLAKRFGGTGPWTDVHALGLILAELTSGQPPHQESDYGELLIAITNANARPTPRALGATVSDAFEAICDRALATNPRERFANAKELLLALQALPAHESPTHVAEISAPALNPRIADTHLAVATWSPGQVPTSQPPQQAPGRAKSDSATKLSSVETFQPSQLEKASERRQERPKLRRWVAVLGAGTTVLALAGLGLGLMQKITAEKKAAQQQEIERKHEEQRKQEEERKQVDAQRAEEAKQRLEKLKTLRNEAAQKTIDARDLLNKTDQALIPATKKSIQEKALLTYELAETGWEAYLKLLVRNIGNTREEYESAFWIADARFHQVELRVLLGQSVPPEKYASARQAAIEVRDSNKSDEYHEPTAQYIVALSDIALKEQL